jgi:uncharacterized alpha-E superfamily protein
MLSRVAERIYWLARYIERAENTARLVNTYHFLLLDMPRGTKVGWHILPYIAGSSELFNECYQRQDERNTVKYLLADSINPASIVNSITMARENARTSRDELPGYAWEQINELYIYTRDNVSTALARRGRFNFLTETILRCQQLTGLLAGTMSHDLRYDFIRIGRNIERADMTTRVIDIGAVSLKEEDEARAHDVHVWTSMLHALNAYQMYRKDVQLGVHCEDVVGYLLQNNYFPRSVAHCIDQIEESIAILPKYKDPLAQLRATRRRVDKIKPATLTAESLHKEVDQIQIGISALHGQICSTWFE